MAGRGQWTARSSKTSSGETLERTRTAARGGGRSGPAPDVDTEAEGEKGEDDLLEIARTPATERRRAADALIALWMDVARDVALCQRGMAGNVREMRLLDETTAAAGRLAVPEVTAFLDRLGRAAVLVRSNVSPELVLDDLALHWPRPATGAA